MTKPDGDGKMSDDRETDSQNSIDNFKNELEKLKASERSIYQTIIGSFVVVFSLISVMQFINFNNSQEFAILLEARIDRFVEKASDEIERKLDLLAPDASLVEGVDPTRPNIMLVRMRLGMRNSGDLKDYFLELEFPFSLSVSGDSIGEVIGYEIKLSDIIANEMNRLRDGSILISRRNEYIYGITFYDNPGTFATNRGKTRLSATISRFSFSCIELEKAMHYFVGIQGESAIVTPIFRKINKAVIPQKFPIIFEIDSLRECTNFESAGSPI